MRQCRRRQRRRGGVGGRARLARGAARVVVGGRHGRAEAASPPGAAAGGEADRAGRFAAPTVLDFGDDAEAFFGSASMRDEIFGRERADERIATLRAVEAEVMRELPPGPTVHSGFPRAAAPGPARG